MITGSGFTVIATVLVLCVPGTEATSDVCIWLEVAGAVYVTDVPVAAERVPQAAPVQFEPLKAQVSGSVPESVAVIAIDCPAYSVSALALVLTMPVPPGYPPPQPLSAMDRLAQRHTSQRTSWNGFSLAEE